MTVAAAADEHQQALGDDGAAMKELEAQQPSYCSLAAPVTNPVDKFALLPAFLKVRGLVKEHIDSFNYFITRGIRKTIEANNRIEARNDPNIYLKYTKVYVGTPSVQVDYKIEAITPHFCRLTDRTYSAPIRVDVEYTVGKQQKPQEKCPLDPGGYFIVKGTEKVILIQEQLSKNCIIIDTDSKGRVIASVTSSTHEIKSKTVITMDKEKVYLQLNQFTKPIPIMVVMKAMGMESDQEIVQMVGRDPRYGDILFPSIQECASERIYTQQQALQYMDEKVTYAGAGNQKEGRARSILRDVFIAHVPVENGNFRQKCIYTGVMLRRMMDAILNADTFDDKDYVGNKRLELSGQLISLLFEDLFKTMNSQAVELMNKNSDRTRSSPSDFSQAGVSCGRFHYGSAFGEPSGNADKVEDISNTLIKHGFSCNGKDFLYSGLRLGEMERDCLIAYGASMLIFEHLLLSSDPYQVQVCRKCGLLGVLQSQTEDSALFNVQERGKYGQDEAAICLQAFVPGVASDECCSTTEVN
ncbi:unnamed protein product [Miscanthus lutarioriparius]|uniref:DNA-directed RNA polymerase n=1 Tax=Miscanthus lutarioriparius TaxID=422564 RepID=A0A811PWD8_9POAL|nr:unnamed protein product [Miscanthus lutarioriparius]